MGCIPVLVQDVSMVKWDEDVYNTPAYPITDAARYLHIPVGTLRSWLQGRSYPTKDGQRYSSPLIQRTKSVLLDPRISFGRPVIVGNRIPTRAIAERYEAGESPESIADDLGCSPSQVHNAIRFEPEAMC